MKIKSGETILFIGDSITDCARRENERPLGNGYVKLFSDMLTIREPRKKIRIINKGIGGETIADLHNRWEDDVISNKPDWLSLKIGINDLHRTLSEPSLAVPLDRYKELYEDVLQQTGSALPRCKILLIEPFYISNKAPPNSQRHEVMELLPHYLKIVRAMAKRHKTLHVNSHSIFQGLLKHHEVETFCPEPVHPNLTGHLVLAEAVYEALS